MKVRMTMLSNIWQSVKDYYESNFHNTTEQEKRDRAETCEKCEFSGILCQKCHCILAVKICIASESCPIGKWDRVDGKPTFLSKKPCKGCNK